MASEVDICNLALTLLGAGRITSLGDDNENARTCAATYAMVRDAEIGDHNWTFSTRRTKLAALNLTPPFEYLYAYQVPNDMICLIMFGERYPGLAMDSYRSRPHVDYRLEGDQILSNLAPPVAIRYNARVIDTSNFDPLFVIALSARLAETICEKVTMSPTKLQLASAKYKEAIKSAVINNCIQFAPEPIADDTWIFSRL